VILLFPCVSNAGKLTVRVLTGFKTTIVGTPSWSAGCICGLSAGNKASHCGRQEDGLATSCRRPLPERKPARVRIGSSAALSGQVLSVGDNPDGASCP
jgi:hypothetical protein